jgi:hypothetical protein
VRHRHLPLFAAAVVALVVGPVVAGVPVATLALALVVLACPIAMLVLLLADLGRPVARTDRPTPR